MDPMHAVPPHSLSRKWKLARFLHAQVLTADPGRALAEGVNGALFTGTALLPRLRCVIQHRLGGGTGKMAQKNGPNRPKPKPVSLPVEETAIVVLDLSARCHDPEEVCSKLMKPLGKF